MNEAKEEKKKQPQKLLLTWMVNEPQLFDKLEGIIGPDDFMNRFTMEWHCYSSNNTKKRKQ